MSLFIASLNSGSNGNCYYVGNNQTAVLIDVGISCREVERRMKRLELRMENVKAVFISHEHGDHISGIEQLSSKYQLPVYITGSTLKSGGLQIEKRLVASFIAFEPVDINGLLVTAFPKYHDASDPHSFVISHQLVTVGVFTDIGVSCKNTIKYFSQCHAAFLEANYDEGMLASGNYPYHLKKRISGGNGHLSNMQAWQLVKDYKPSFMSHLILSHLSKNNNDPSLVQRLFDKGAGPTKIVVASRYEETPVYYIAASKETMPVQLRRKAIANTYQQQQQLSLF